MNCKNASINACSECESPSFLTILNTCDDICGIGFYGDINLKKCNKCHDSCKECFSFEINNCLSCLGNEFLQTSQNVCAEHCESNEFKNIINNSC